MILSRHIPGTYHHQGMIGQLYKLNVNHIRTMELFLLPAGLNQADCAKVVVKSFFESHSSIWVDFVCLDGRSGQVALRYFKKIFQPL